MKCLHVSENSKCQTMFDNELSKMCYNKLILVIKNDKLFGDKVLVLVSPELFLKFQIRIKITVPG